MCASILRNNAAVGRTDRAIENGSLCYVGNNYIKYTTKINIQVPLINIKGKTHKTLYPIHCGTLLLSVLFIAVKHFVNSA